MAKNHSNDDFFEYIENNGEDGYQQDQVRMAVAEFMMILLKNIEAAGVPEEVETQLKVGITQKISDGGDYYNAIVGFEDSENSGLIKKSIISEEKGFLPTLYNYPNKYYKDYKASNPKSYIMYYPNKIHPTKYGPFALNQPFGKGSLFFEKAVEQFKKKYKDVECIINT